MIYSKNVLQKISAEDKNVFMTVGLMEETMFNFPNNYKLNEQLLQLNHGVLQRPRGGVRVMKQTDKMRAKAVEIVESNPDFTLNQILSELHTSLPQCPRISRSTLSNILHGQLIVMKHLKTCPTDRNSDATKQRRFDYSNWLMNDGVQEEELIFVDETALNLWPRRSRGRAQKGERAVQIVGGQRYNNFTKNLPLDKKE